jgi:RNA polymerase sigma factor (sigma-70 family)
MTGQKAIEGCKRQDRICQKYIFDRWSEAMLMLCLRYVRSLPDAEELMLNGFFAFFRSIDRFKYENDGSISAWLKKIMVNECLMFLRKKGELKLVEEKFALATGTDEVSTGKMTADEILRSVTALPCGYRTVFNLFVVEGYSHKEIATLLNITEGTSKSQLSKARAMLQKNITIGSQSQ